MERNLEQVHKLGKNELPKDLANRIDLEKCLLDQFQELHIREKKKIIAALLMFLSAQEENAFDHLLTYE